jgi:hypothetical protein
MPALALDGSHTGSLNANGAEIRGSFFLNNAFFATGEVNLAEARIGGSLECSNGTFHNPGAGTLSADDLDVRGNVFLRDSLSEGEIRLLRARIGGNLDCEGATFTNPGRKAFSADGVVVKGNIFLRYKFSADGEVRLPGAQIGGNVECEGGSFQNRGAVALDLEAAKVAGSVFLRKDFGSEGMVRLVSVQIGGDLACTGGGFRELYLESATVKGNFSWDDVLDPRSARLDLINASVGALVDEKESWPERGHLRLDGFVYDRISGGPTDAPARLEWIDRQKEFTRQPYRQLAKVLREIGDEDGSKRVLFEMEHRARAESRRRLILPMRMLQRAGDTIYEGSVGYGLHPLWALGWLAVLWGTGWVLFRRTGVMVPTERGAYAEFRESGHAPAYYPPFNPLIYSLENCVPLVKLGQDERWQPDPNPQQLVDSAASAAGWRGRLKHLVLVRLPERLTSPVALRWLRWIMIGLGWLLATFFVAGLTGIIKTG